MRRAARVMRTFRATEDPVARVQAVASAVSEVLPPSVRQAIQPVVDVVRSGRTEAEIAAAALGRLLPPEARGLLAGVRDFLPPEVQRWLPPGPPAPMGTLPSPFVDVLRIANAAAEMAEAAGERDVARQIRRVSALAGTFGSIFRRRPVIRWQTPGVRCRTAHTAAPFAATAWDSLGRVRAAGTASGARAATGRPRARRAAAPAGPAALAAVTTAVPSSTTAAAARGPLGYLRSAAPRSAGGLPVAGLRPKDSRKGFFEPSHPEKYAGKRPIVWRSTWELRVMQLLDRHPAVVRWASEPFPIPYTDPVTRRGRLYWPDFLVEYVDAQGRRRREIVEIKPAEDVGLTEARDPVARAEIARNHAKWKAAAAWAKRHGMGFRVLTEIEIFGRPGSEPRRKAKRPPRRRRRT